MWSLATSASLVSPGASAERLRGHIALFVPVSPVCGILEDFLEETWLAMLMKYVPFLWPRRSLLVYLLRINGV